MHPGPEGGSLGIEVGGTYLLPHPLLSTVYGRQWLADALKENDPSSVLLFLVGSKKDLSVSVPVWGGGLPISSRETLHLASDSDFPSDSRSVYTDGEGCTQGGPRDEGRVLGSLIPYW